MPTVYAGSNALSAIYAGSSEVLFVYQGSSLVWTSYLYYTGTDLSASEESDWSFSGTGASFSRVNGNTEFRFAAGATSAVATFDLYSVCTPGNNYNISINVVSVDPGDDVDAGLYSATTNTTSFTTNFANSPLGPADTGTQTLTNQVVNASNRYLKLYAGIGEAINFNTVAISNA